MVGIFNLFAQTGSIRRLSGISSTITPDHTLQGIINGWYADSTTNITSLTILTDIGTFSGTIKLYKTG